MFTPKRVPRSLWLVHFSTPEGIIYWNYVKSSYQEFYRKLRQDTFPLRYTRSISQKTTRLDQDHLLFGCQKDCKVSSVSSPSNKERWTTYSLALCLSFASDGLNLGPPCPESQWLSRVWDWVFNVFTRWLTTPRWNDLMWVRHLRSHSTYTFNSRLKSVFPSTSSCF